VQKIEGEMVGEGCCVIVGGRITVAPRTRRAARARCADTPMGGGMDLSTFFDTSRATQSWLEQSGCVSDCMGLICYSASICREWGAT